MVFFFLSLSSKKKDTIKLCGCEKQQSTASHDAPALEILHRTRSHWRTIFEGIWLFEFCCNLLGQEKLSRPVFCESCDTLSVHIKRRGRKKKDVSEEVWQEGSGGWRKGEEEDERGEDGGLKIRGREDVLVCWVEGGINCPLSCSTPVSPLAVWEAGDLGGRGLDNSSPFGKRSVHPTQTHTHHTL